MHTGSTGLPFLGWGKQGGAGENVPEWSRVVPSILGSRLSKGKNVSPARTQEEVRPGAAGGAPASRVTSPRPLPRPLPQLGAGGVVQEGGQTQRQRALFVRV